MAYNLKSLREEFKKSGVFYTPPDLAKKIKEYVNFIPDDVYDPTCGDGSLLSVFDKDIPKYGQEIDGQQLEVAKDRLCNFFGFEGNTLINPAFIDKKFHCIVANYPFSTKWEPITDIRFQSSPCIPSQSRSDYAFILHILHYLRDDGIAVTLNFPGIGYRGGREQKIRKWIIEKNYIERVISIPPNTFVDTSIGTLLIVFNKSKTTTDIIFEDLILGKRKNISIIEISDKEYSLSVNSYISDDVVKEVIDPIELQRIARKNFMRNLINELKIDSAICDLEGWDKESFYQDIINIVVSFRSNN